eukprot:12405185-Karenia_brevis.AAC.1
MKLNFLDHRPLPKLKGRAVDIKVLGRPLAWAMHKIHNVEDPIQRKILLALRLNNELEEIIDRNPSTIVRYSERDGKQFLRCAVAFCMVVTDVARRFHGLHIKLFNRSQRLPCQPCHEEGHGEMDLCNCCHNKTKKTSLKNMHVHIYYDYDDDDDVDYY